jgi:hypothetical protein
MVVLLQLLAYCSSTTGWTHTLERPSSTHARWVTQGWGARVQVQAQLLHGLPACHVCMLGHIRTAWASGCPLDVWHHTHLLTWAVSKSLFPTSMTREDKTGRPGGHSFQ